MSGVCFTIIQEVAGRERGGGEGEGGSRREGGRKQGKRRKRTGRENQWGNPDKSDKCRIWMMGLWVFAVPFSLLYTLKIFIIKSLSTALVCSNLHLFLNDTFIYKLQVCQNMMCA